jgi:predicted secreted protein
MLYLASICCLLFAAEVKQPMRLIAPSQQVTKVTVGEAFEVALIGNPSTGRYWEAVGIPAGLEQVGRSKYEDIPHFEPLKVMPSRPRIGAPMLCVFTFRAKSASEGVISFRMAQSSGFQTAEIKFVVQGK